MSAAPLFRTPGRYEAAFVCLGALLVTLGWTLYAGKDASWDVFNHHLYLPFSLLSGRHALDLFGAGPQSYQNPLGYLPFYLLVRAELPSWLVGVALAALHAVLAAWPTYRIARAIWDDPADRFWRALAVAMAWVAPIHLIVAGTSSIDPIGAGLVLLSVAAVLTRRPATGLLALGALALGLAVAIKPSNAAFAIAVGAAGFVRCLTGQMPWRQALLFVAISVFGLLAAGGYWAHWLWTTFGNPVFPLFNHLFGSPFAPTGAAVAHRFIPLAPVDWLARLWEMAEFRSYTVTEAFVPDLRPAAVALAGAALLLLTGWKRGWRAWLRKEVWARADLQLAVVALVSYLLWMATSGNARYAVAWFMIIGLLLVRSVQLLAPRPVAKVGLGVLLAVQTFAYVSAGDLRYIDAPFDSRPYIRVSVPPTLRDQPFLHLSLGVQTFASVAPYLNRGGALVNVSGQMSLPHDGPLGAALKERLKTWEGRTRFLFLAPAGFEDPAEITKVAERTRNLTYRIGLAIDWRDCLVIWIDGDTTAAPGEPAPRRTQRASTPLMSCAAVPGRTDDRELEAELARAEQVFALVQAACPKVYGPVPLTSDLGNGVIQRRYLATDARVNVSPTEGVTVAHFRSLTAVSMGSIDEVIASKGHNACLAWQKLSMQ